MEAHPSHLTSSSYVALSTNWMLFCRGSQTSNGQESSRNVSSRGHPGPPQDPAVILLEPYRRSYGCCRGGQVLLRSGHRDIQGAPGTANARRAVELNDFSQAWAMCHRLHVIYGEKYT